MKCIVQYIWYNYIKVYFLKVLIVILMLFLVYSLNKMHIWHALLHFSNFCHGNHIEWWSLFIKNASVWFLLFLFHFKIFVKNLLFSLPICSGFIKMIFFKSLPTFLFILNHASIQYYSLYKLQNLIITYQ